MHLVKVGVLCSDALGPLTSSPALQDMAPYVPLLMPELQNALVDPLPEVRATAAHALGSLLRGMGEQHFQGLMPWLLTTLKSEVRRSGPWLPLMQVCWSKQL